ncbi:MAG: triose-phosphate isomerase [Verrucomicrobiota bacterium]
MAKERKLIIAANWKMYKTPSEGRELAKDLVKELKGFTDADLVVCPPYPALAAVGEAINDEANFALGAQNLHHLPEGAYTGDVSGAMLRDLYCRYVIIGHSERRQYHGETNLLIHDKIKAAVECNLKPIVCIGEKLEEREANAADAVLETQLRESLIGLDAKQIGDVTLAYEPVWAIGTGKTATPEIAQEAHHHIRKILVEIFDEATAKRTRIQYGGSVKAANAAELLQLPDVDGALVGSASLDAGSFAGIVKNACA